MCSSDLVRGYVFPSPPVFLALGVRRLAFLDDANDIIRDETLKSLPGSVLLLRFLSPSEERACFAHRLDLKVQFKRTSRARPLVV